MSDQTQQGLYMNLATVQNEAGANFLQVQFTQGAIMTAIMIPEEAAEKFVENFRKEILQGVRELKKLRQHGEK